jgi:hypothetical protein
MCSVRLSRICHCILSRSVRRDVCGTRFAQTPAQRQPARVRSFGAAGKILETRSHRTYICRCICDKMSMNDVSCQDN